MVEGWKERAGRNEAIFREVNDSIAELEEQLDSGSESLPLICECARPACATRVEIGIAEYKSVRAHPDRFILAHGHEQLEVEQIVERSPGYVVVEKVGAAAEAADLAT